MHSLRPCLTVFAIVFALCIGATQSAEGGFKEGLAAYNRGDYATALREYRPLAERGNSSAQYNLGQMYRIGKGVLKDYKEAAKWYRKAANQGDADAQFNLGVMYDKGQGVLKDDKEAVKWWTKAANQGHSGGQYNLGLMYVRGKGVIKDLVQGHMWFNLASISGESKNAIKNRDIAEKIMSRSEIQEATRLAREWLRKHKK